LNVDNVGAERTCRGRLLQATDRNSHAKCPVAELYSLVLVRPNHHEQRNGEQKGWEQWKLECTSRSDNMVLGRRLPFTPVGRVLTRCVPLPAASTDDRRV